MQTEKKSKFILHVTYHLWNFLDIITLCLFLSRMEAAKPKLTEPPQSRSPKKELIPKPNQVFNDSNKDILSRQKF